MEKTILEVKNLTCIFNEKTNNEFKAIDNFSYNFKENKIYFIIGNSGSGKSTLVAHFNGLLKSKYGEINVGNFKIPEKKRKIKNVKTLRRIISMVFQFPEYQLFKTTIEKDISFGPIALGIPKIKSHEINLLNLKKEIFGKELNNICEFFNISNKNYSSFNEMLENEKINFKYKIYPKKDFGKFSLIRNNKKYTKKILFSTKTPDDYAHELAIKYLTRMGLDESYLDRSPFELSGGQKRRVAIAGILAIEPKILIFDEPTAGLDPQGEQEMMQIILDAKKHGQTIIVITHTMDQVLEIGDEVIVLDKGKILFSGTPYEIFTNKDLYEKTKMEKPKVIDFIDDLSKKEKRFNILYNFKPRNSLELVHAIKKITMEKKESK